MYRYDEFDERLVRERSRSFASRSARRLDGSLTEDEFTPLRLMNGLYLQLHAYMLRVAIPYGTLNPRQLRQLAMIADRYDRGYGHFTTRQNIQFNWPRLADVPDILELLADVEMHCIQTSGNCIRNVTADHFAGVAADEIEDPRPTAELIRQWSTLHPEFSFLPRKFKIAVTGARATTAPRSRVHDIGVQHRPQRRGRDRLPDPGRRRPGPDADDRQGDPRIPAERRAARLSRGDHAGLQSRRAGATTSTRRGSRSWSTRSAPRRSSARVEEEFAALDRRAVLGRSGRARPGSPPISRRRPMSRCRRSPPRSRLHGGATPPSPLRRDQPLPAQGAGLYALTRSR